MTAATSRLSRTQQDVINRLKAGATIEDGYAMTYILKTPGGPDRHVAWNTVHSLMHRGLLRGVSPSPIGGNGSYRWVIA